MDTTQILNLENVLSEKECMICYDELLNVEANQYYEWLKKINDKYNLNCGKLEDDTCLRLEEYAFKCPTCKNIVCDGCVGKFRQGIVYAKVSGYGGSDIRRLTNEEILYIENEGYDIKNIVDDDNQSEIYKLPTFYINGICIYGFMRGRPGDDGEIICPFCRQSSE